MNKLSVIPLRGRHHGEAMPVFANPTQDNRSIALLPAYIVVLITFIFPYRADAENVDNSNIFRNWAEIALISKSKPQRFDGNLRQENLNDIEVREIIHATRKIMPGAIVTIDGVRSGCPCEDGPDCSAQVWVVAHELKKTSGLMLSKIKQRWIIGPVQQWWLQYESLLIKLKLLGREPRPYTNGIIEKANALRMNITNLGINYPACTNKN